MKKLIFILFPVFSYGQITINKSFLGANTSTSDVTSFGQGPATFTAGRLYIFMTASTGGANHGGVGGTTLTWDTLIIYGDATRRIEIFYVVPNSTVSGESVAVGSFGGAITGFTAAVWEVTGFNTTTPFAQLNFDTQTGTDPTITLGTLQSNHSAVVAFFFNSNNPFGGTPESGWSEDFDNGYATPDAGSYLMSRVNTIDPTPTVTSASSTWIGVAFELKAAGRRISIIN